VPDPFTIELATTIATAIATQAAQALTSQARHALADIRQRVLRKFKDRPDLAVLANTQNAPSSQEHIAALAAALRQAAHQDPSFGSDILALWAPVQNQITSFNDSAAANIFHGHADKVVQIHDIHGNLTIT
jgi:hypothetical protein